jgi:hypothetical protein
MKARLQKYELELKAVSFPIFVGITENIFARNFRERARFVAFVCENGRKFCLVCWEIPRLMSKT